MDNLLIRAKKASEILRIAPQGVRSAAIKRIAELIKESRAMILEENAKDLTLSKNTLSAAMTDRLMLNEKRVHDIADAALKISAQPDPIGEVVSGNVRPNGLRIIKTRVPLGVVGIIYESRPNVTVDCAALCLRAANVCILRGGKEAHYSNHTFCKLIKQALTETGLPADAVTLLNDPDRSQMLAMMKAPDFVDLIIPRGGEALISFVTENATVPVVKHDKGVCHIFVDESADIPKALNIIENAKLSRPSACNALEALLVHEKIARHFLPLVKQKLGDTELRGCENACAILPMQCIPANEWGSEYLDRILAVKVVSGVKDAIKHIEMYGSRHSDAILTENYTNAQIFLNHVDSACVYINASTRFTDGGEFGLGAEVGISTQKLHARGPMGAFDLTTTKYLIYGEGQTRS